jgi:hypothetical protein
MLVKLNKNNTLGFVGELGITLAISFVDLRIWTECEHCSAQNNKESPRPCHWHWKT